MKVFVLVVLSVVVSASDACLQCPEYWTLAGDSCYRVFGKEKSWEDAQKACHELYNSANVRANLASIHDTNENYVIHQLWSTATGEHKAAYWIGLHDKNIEGYYEWMDKSTVSFTYWDSGEPNNSGNEDCVHVRRGHSLHWNDGDCGNAFPYVCKVSAANVEV